MQTTLIGQLAADIQLPACLRVVGCVRLSGFLANFFFCYFLFILFNFKLNPDAFSSLLRRMGAFPEPELRLRFLRAREAWLRGVLLAVPLGADPAVFLVQTMDLYRVNVFDIATQFKVG